MEITEKLKSKKIVNYYKNLRQDLQEQAEKSILSQLFSKPKLKKDVATLGLLFLGKENHYQELTLGSKKTEEIKKYLKPDIWEDQEFYKLLVYFFGENADFVKYAWNKMPYKMYQSGYDRRSFRAPNNEKFVLLNQINLIKNLLQFPSTYSYSSNFEYYNLSLEEQIIYDHALSNNSSQFYIWSAAIDNGNKEIYQLIEDIIFNKHTEGKVSQNIIKALLNSEQKHCWELVEKL